jgi:hypothetical protein
MSYSYPEAKEYRKLALEAASRVYEGSSASASLVIATAKFFEKYLQQSYFDFVQDSPPE